MGMGAAKPGSTLPPQGGKGGVQPPFQPTVPPQGGKGGVQPPLQPTVPPQGGKGGVRPTTNSPLQPGATIFNGVVTPNTIGPNGLPVGGTMPPGQPIPPQGSKGNNRPLPEHYQSPYATYGFDPALQSYLDQQNHRSTFDGGVSYQYDPTNQTFTGGTRSGSYNPIPLNVMQQAAGGNRDVLNPYFQSNFPQQPQVQKPDLRLLTRQPQMPQPQVMPANSQRGLGGLQGNFGRMNNFRNTIR